MRHIITIHNGAGERACARRGVLRLAPRARRWDRDVTLLFFGAFHRSGRHWLRRRRGGCVRVGAHEPHVRVDGPRGFSDACDIERRWHAIVMVVSASASSEAVHRPPRLLAGRVMAREPVVSRQANAAAHKTCAGLGKKSKTSNPGDVFTLMWSHQPSSRIAFSRVACAWFRLFVRSNACRGETIGRSGRWSARVGFPRRLFQCLVRSPMPANESALTPAQAGSGFGLYQLCGLRRGERRKSWRGLDRCLQLPVRDADSGNKS